MLCRVGYLISQSTRNRFDFFVDSVNGSDANNGLSAATPKATLAAAVTLVGSSANKRVGLARGSSWREQLSIGNPSTPQNGIYIGAYGSGARPVIDSADAISAGAWSKTAGLTNVYQATVATTGSTFNTMSVLPWLNIWENGVYLANVTSQALCDSTPGSYYVADMTVTNPTIFVHTSDGSNPGVNGKTYEFTARAWSIQVSGDNCTVRSINTKRNYSTSGSLVINGRSAYLNDCQADLGSKHNIFVGEGTIVESCFLTDGYWGTGSGNLFVCFQQTATGLPFTVRNTTFNQGVTLTTSISAVTSHAATGSMGQGSYIGCRFNANNGVSFVALGGDPSLLVATNCVGSNLLYLMNTTVNATLSGCQHVSTHNPNSLLLVSTAGVSVTVDGCQACVSSVQNGIVQTSQANVTFTITNNKFLLNTTQNASPAHIFDQKGSGSSLTLSGNTFETTYIGGGSYAYNLFNASTSPTLVSDNNAFLTPNVHQFLIGTASYSTLALYQAGTSQDSHSVTTGSTSGVCTLPS